MPTDKHRIAAYLPSEVNEKFQVFKQERGVGDSQALILILTEFLGVSHQVTHDSLLNIEVLKDDLRSELLSELDARFGELKSELLRELPEVKNSGNSLVSKKVSCEFIDRPMISQREGFTNAQLSIRFDCDSALVRKQKSKYRDDPEKFIAWSRSRDPEGWGWKFDETSKLFTPVVG